MYKRIENIFNNIVKFNINKKALDKFNVYLTIFILILMMIPGILNNFIGVGFDSIHNYYLLLLIPLIYVFIYNIKNKYHKNSIDFIFISIFMIIALISSIHAFNPWTAFFGDTNRKTGYLMYLVYYFLYVNSKNINNKDDLFKILNVMFIIGIINTLFALLQVYLPYNNIIHKFYQYIGYGLMGHHNFLGTFSLLLLSLSLYISLFISDKKFYKFTTIIMFICLLLTNSSGPFLSFGLIFLILFIYIIIKKHHLIKKILIYSLIFIVLFFTVEISSSYVNKIYKPNVIVTNLQSDMINTLRIFGINIGDIKQPDIVIKMPKDGELDLMGGMNTVSSGRLDVYKSVIRYIDHGNYLWLGTGPDNMQVYSIYFVRKSINQATFIVYDKAHNVYLNVIAETGIFSFIFYIAWIVSCHLKTKKCKNELMYLLLFGLISYNIQGLFNIDVYMVMPYYLIIAGMLMGIGDKLETRKH